MSSHTYYEHKGKQLTKRGKGYGTLALLPIEEGTVIDHAKSSYDEQ